MVYARELDGKALTLIVSGKLWRNSLIMMDLETGSLWSHVSGECLEGTHIGRRLERIPAVQTGWAAWRAAHPATRVLKKSAEIRSSRYESYFSDPDRAGIFRTFWLKDRLPAKALVHGLVDGPHAVAVTDAALSADKPVVVELNGLTITVAHDAAGGVRAHGPTGEELIVQTAFWFAWSSFHPNTAVVD